MDDFTQCDHPIRVAGMCAVCGRALDEDDRGASAQAQQLHDISGVQVTNAEAARLDSESTRRLLDQKKLALIVDLDQTIIHATVDPTVGEWMKDAKNPNYSALADVGKFLLGVDGKEVLQHDQDDDGEASGASGSDVNAVQDGCWYYVKPRPGLQAFLRRMSETYEMHVYTMGTRTYAESVCRLVDPQGTIFGARIISRDENGSLVQKSLKKLFPMDTSMVVIIDDRADVWQWSPHLVRVTPFDFFVGIGDINATFLPSIPAGPSPTPEAAAATTAEDEAKLDDGRASGAEDAPGSESEKAAQAKARAEDDAAKSVAEESQKSAVNEQLDARPLAKMQEALEEKDASLRETDKSPQQAAVLKENDRELDKLQGILEEVHVRWYAQYDSLHSEAEDKPTTRTIISQLKTAVLDGCTVVFSSIAPLQQDPTTTDLWRLASEFGAVCKRAIDSTVTHVVTARQGTEKVIQGHRRGLHVVWFSWLQESCASWVRQSESQYELPKPLGRSKQGADEASKSQEDTSAIGNDNQIGQNGFNDSGDEEMNPSNDGSEGEGGYDDDDQEGFGEMNWDEANDEVDAALEGLSGDDRDYDEDEDDNSSVGGDREGYESDASASEGKAMKRSRSVRSDRSDHSNSEEGATSSSSNQETLSPLSKRRRMAELRAGHSKLKQVMTRDSSQAPTTDGVSDASAKGIAQEGEGEDDSFLLSLEEELELQLGAEESGELVS